MYDIEIERPQPAKDITMKLALYYDFMLYNRALKPFNNFLVQQKKLTNKMYTSVLQAQQLVGSLPMVIKPEQELRDALQASPTNTDTIDSCIFKITSGFQKNVKPDSPDFELFLPTTSQQVDANITTLVSNIGSGLYDCSQDAIMAAIKAGKFDEYLSKINREQMMSICRPAAAAAAAPEEKKGFFSFLGFGGRKTKRSNKRLKKSNKRLKKSNKRSNKGLKKSKLNKKYKGGMSGRAPESYVGSIGGRFINSNGQQLFRNPVGGIA
jgi:hypothetical protein